MFYSSSKAIYLLGQGVLTTKAVAGYLNYLRRKIELVL